MGLGSKVETLERDIRQAIAHLRRYRNESVPINRLPPELFRVILGHLKHPPSSRSCPSSQLPRFKLDFYSTLISAMLVCHKWHEIGLQAASLWTDIDFARRGAFAPILLSRSLGASIRLSGYLDEEDTLRTAIMDHRARIRELDLWVAVKFSNLVPVVQSILAADMPRVRILSLSYDGQRSAIIVNSDAPVSLPALEAMLLRNLLFVPAHVLPQLTHLHLAWLNRVDSSSILNLLRNTPALEVFDAIQCQEFTAPANSAPPTTLFLPRLHSVYIWSMTSTVVHDLMTRLETPNLASLRLSSIFARSGTWLSTPLIPSSLVARTISRLAFDVGGNFSHFRANFHGNDISLTMDISATEVQDTERSRWAFDVFPTILPLSSVEEFHFQARRWDMIRGAEHLLPHLAARMPNVSTLFIKHNERMHKGDKARLMDLARVIVALLESDSPVLFPHLAHLELIVSDIPWEFCQLIARALAKCDLDGRRLRKLRIWLDDRYRERWNTRRRYGMEPNFGGIGIQSHVDSVKIGERKIGRSGKCDEESSNTLGWGEWRDRVRPRRHDYW